MNEKNGGKATIREVFTLVQGMELRQNDKRDDMERRLVQHVTTVVDGLEERIDKRYETRLCTAETRIDGLRFADKKWATVVTAISAVLAGLAALVKS